MSNACKIWIKKGRDEPWQEHDPNGELVALRAKVATLQTENDAMRSTSRGKYAVMNAKLKAENTFLRGTVEALGDANDRLTIEVAALRKDKERYEWLKGGKGSHWAYNYLRDNFRINDDAIDAARAKEGGAS